MTVVVVVEIINNNVINYYYISTYLVNFHMEYNFSLIIILYNI